MPYTRSGNCCLVFVIVWLRQRSRIAVAFEMQHYHRWDTGCCSEVKRIDADAQMHSAYDPAHCYR